MTLSAPWTWSAGTLNLCLDGHTVDGSEVYGSDAVLHVSGGEFNLYDDKEGGISQSDVLLVKVTVVDAGACTSLGANAFRDCTGLTQIRLPKDCAIGDGAFDGCTGLSAIFAPAGGSTQAWAEAHGIPFGAMHEN